jgi:phosphatidylglycerophosphatase A
MESAPNTNSPQGNLQPDICAAIVVTLTLAVAAVALRFTARRLVRMPLWLDDWLTLSALVCHFTLSLLLPKLDANIFGRLLQSVSTLIYLSVSLILNYCNVTSDIGRDSKIFLVVKNGTGLHIQAIDRDTTQIYHDFFLGLWIAELFYTLALTPAKLAFLAFYWRIFRISSIKLPIKIMAVTVMCWAISRASISCSSPFSKRLD